MIRLPYVTCAVDFHANQRWFKLGKQRQLQALNYSPQQNAADREACRRLMSEGYGSDDAFLTWLYGQK